jgi:hypothetical protein
VITIIIVVIWYIVRPISFNNPDSQNVSGTSTFDELNQSIGKIGEEINKFQEMFASTTGTTTEDSTSTASSTI